MAINKYGANFQPYNFQPFGEKKQVKDMYDLDLEVKENPDHDIPSDTRQTKTHCSEDCQSADCGTAGETCLGTCKTCGATCMGTCCC